MDVIYNQKISELSKGDDDVRKNIEAERARCGLSRTELAKKLNVSRHTLSNWIDKEKSFPCTYVVQMASIFSCTTDYLLDLTDDRHGSYRARTN